MKNYSTTELRKPIDVAIAGVSATATSFQASVSEPDPTLIPLARPERDRRIYEHDLDKLEVVLTVKFRGDQALRAKQMIINLFQ